MICAVYNRSSGNTDIEEMMREIQEKQKEMINGLSDSHKVLFALEVFAINEKIVPKDFYLLLKDADFGHTIKNLKRYYKRKKGEGKYEGKFEDFIEEREKAGDPEAIDIKDFLESNEELLEGYGITTILYIYNLYSRRYWEWDPRRLLEEMKIILGYTRKNTDFFKTFESEKGVKIISCKNRSCSDKDECSESAEKHGAIICPGFKHVLEREVNNSEILERSEYVRPHILKSYEFFEISKEVADKLKEAS